MTIATTHSVELIRIGEDGGIKLPPDALERLGTKAGDVVVVQQTTSGVEIRPLTEHERQMEIAKKIMAERHGLLRRLAE